MKTLAQLQQERNVIATEMRNLHQSIGEEKWTEEQQRSWTGMLEKLDAADAVIAREEKLNQTDQRSMGQTFDQDGVHISDADNDLTDLESRQLDAVVDYLANGFSDASKESRNILKEMRANTTTPDTKGGYTVPKLFRNRVVDAMKQFGGLANIATILNTASGNPINWPTTDGTLEVGAMIGETEKTSEEDLVFDSVVLGAKKCSSKIIKVSNELLTDTGIDLLGLIARRAGQRIGRAEASQLITGAGTGNNIKGLQLQANVGHSAAKGTKIAWDVLLKHKHSVDPAYRGQAKWMFNDNTLLALKTMKDTMGRPIWQPDLVGGAPGLIDGDQYQIDQAMPDWADGKKPVSYGDHSAVQLRRVIGMGLKRLDEIYAESDLVGFLMFHRFDMVLEDKAAVKLLEIKAA